MAAVNQISPSKARVFRGVQLSDVFTEDEMANLNLYISAVYGDEDVSVEDVQDVDPANLINKLQEATKNGFLDYTAIKLILKVLRAVPIESPCEFAERFIELLYHTPRDFCLLVGGLAQRNPDKALELASILTKAVQTAPYSDMSLTRIWVAHLFVTQALPISDEVRVRLDLTHSVVERRQDLLLRGILRDRPFFRAQKTKFSEANDWEKPALMLGAACLSKSEYKTWLSTISPHSNDPTAELFRKWLEVNQENHRDLLRENFVIKSKSERLTELFGNHPIFSRIAKN